MSEEDKKENPTLCLGLDIGTMHICCSRSDSDEVKITRNVFLSLDKDDIQITELSEITYIESGDSDLFIVGSDAFKYANIFGAEVSRPMESGLISPKEIAAIDVLTLMIKDLIGDVKEKDTYCSFSVPAEAVDLTRSITYHENVFARILGSLGINYTSVNEAMAIIYSECAKEKFSGIGISFGAGMANCLSGDTEIPLLDGSVKTMKELSEEYRNEKFWVYSCKEDGSIVPGLAHNPRKTGIKEVVRIHLDNGTYFDCTEDHPIMMRDGKYTEAVELKENDSLMPLYLEESRWNEMPGYLSCYNNKKRYWEMVHNMVMCEYHRIYRGKGYVTHHKNFNKKDNTPENLLSCKKENHFKFHKAISQMGGKAAAKIIIEQRKGKMLEEIYGEEKARELKETMSKNTKRWILENGHPNLGKEISTETKQKMSKKKKGLIYYEIMSDKEAIEERKKQLSERCKEQKPWLYRKKMINSGTWKKGNVPWNKGLKGDDYEDHFKNGFKNQYTNHKVIKIERLNIFREVYDLTVDRYNNFAINNGIFVHNCAVAYKGIEALTFSTARAGDWIDQNTGDSLGMIPNRVTSIKEKYMKFTGEVEVKNKKTKRVLEALYYYYKALIEYTVKRIIEEFDTKVNIEVDEPLPIVVSGGTSMPEGFIELFTDVIMTYDLPFELSEIRRARNPMTAVANGLLIKTKSDIKGMK